MMASTAIDLNQCGARHPGRGEVVQSRPNDILGGFLREMLSAQVTSGGSAGGDDGG